MPPRNKSTRQSKARNVANEGPEGLPLPPATAATQATSPELESLETHPSTPISLTRTYAQAVASPPSPRPASASPPSPPIAAAGSPLSPSLANVSHLSQRQGGGENFPTSGGTSLAAPAAASPTAVSADSHELTKAGQSQDRVGETPTVRRRTSELWTQRLTSRRTPSHKSSRTPSGPKQRQQHACTKRPLLNFWP